MATYSITSGKKTYKDSASSADTYVIGADAKSMTLAGKVNGDTIAVEGLASEYKVRASGRTITLTNDDGQKIVFQLATNGSATIKFLDGGLVAGYNGKSATLGSQKLSSKAAVVSETGIDESKASADTFDSASGGSSGGSGGGSTPSVPGSTLAFTTATDDTLVGTTKNDAFNGVISATTSKQTFDTGDKVIDPSSTDSDVVNLTADDDVTDIPTLTGIELVKMNLDALTTATGTTWTVKLDNIAKDTGIAFDNVATKTAVNGLDLTTDKGGARTVSADFLTAKSDTTANSSWTMMAVGTKGSNATLTLTGAATNATVSGAGFLTLDAGAVTGMIDVTAANTLTVKDAGDAAALFATSTNGDLVVTDAAKATLVNLKAGGDITATATALTAATSVTATAGDDVDVKITAATSATISAGGDITIEETGNALVELTVAATGKTSAVDLTKAGNLLDSISTSGAGNVTIELDASNVDNLTSDKIAIAKGNSGTLGLILSTAAGDADLSGAKYDSLEIAVDNNAKTTTVATGQAITISADQTDLTIAGLLATAATNTVTITLDDDARDANDVDLTKLTFKNIGTAVINANVDKTASGTKTTPQIGSLISSGSTDVTINAGTNELELATAITLSGANTLTLTGSADMKSSAADITAAKLVASAFTGVVTLTSLDAGNLPEITTGSAADAITFIDAGDLKVVTGGGNDTLTLKTDADYSANTLTIDLGAGTGDTLALDATGDLLIDDADKTSISLSGIENLEYTTSLSIQDSLISGQSWFLKDNTAGAATITVGVASGTTSVDLTKLQVKSANATAIEGDTFKVDASGAGGGVTVTGTSLGLNTLSGSTSGANKLVGGKFVDTINAGFASDTITGGAGADTFNLKAATGASATKFVTITDFEVNDATKAAVDVLDMGTAGGAMVTVLSGFTATGNVLTKAGSTLADFVTAVQGAQAAGADKDAYAYLTGSDVYIYSTGASKAVATDDVLVKLVGVGSFGIDVETAASKAGLITVTI